MQETQIQDRALALLKTGSRTHFASEQVFSGSTLIRAPSPKGTTEALR